MKIYVVIENWAEFYNDQEDYIPIEDGVRVLSAHDSKEDAEAFILSYELDPLLITESDETEMLADRLFRYFRSKEYEDSDTYFESHLEIQETELRTKINSSYRKEVDRVAGIGTSIPHLIKSS